MEFPTKRSRSQDEEELKTPTKKRRVPFVKAVEKDFQILIEHLARKSEEERKKDNNEYGEEQCVHEGIETDEAFVCQHCGLVLGSLYGPDVHWFDHAVMLRVYSARDQLNAVDKALYKFIDRICLQTDLPIVHGARTPSSDEDRRWLQELELRHCPQLRTGGRPCGARRDSTIPSKVEQCVGSIDAFDVSTAGHFLEELVEQPDENVLDLRPTVVFARSVQTARGTVSRKCPTARRA